MLRSCCAARVPAESCWPGRGWPRRARRVRRGCAPGSKWRRCTQQQAPAPPQAGPAARLQGAEPLRRSWNGRAGCWRARAGSGVVASARRPDAAGVRAARRPGAHGYDRGPLPHRAGQPQLPAQLARSGRGLLGGTCVRRPLGGSSRQCLPCFGARPAAGVFDGSKNEVRARSMLRVHMHKELSATSLRLPHTQKARMIAAAPPQRFQSGWQQAKGQGHTHRRSPS